MALSEEKNKQNEGVQKPTPPSISLPKGGGAIRGIGEKFAANPVTGTGSMSVPIATSPGRSGFGPQLSLSYDSGSGNGPFGFGWSLSLPSITRKTDKGLPKYQDGDESDTFILSGAEDLVPVLKKQGNDWVPEEVPDRTIGTDTYHIKRYRPRIEGLFARIERWTNTQSNETHWRSISRDNIITVYGRTTDSRIEDPEAPKGSPRVFSWLICESYDDKGNAIYYEYAPENSAGIDRSQTNERNRTDKSRSANRYLKRIKYGNKTPVVYDSDLPREFRENLSECTDWLFEVVFDYEEGHYEELPADPNAHQFVHAYKDPAQDWLRRQDPFSSYRAGFEVRTYRLCHRVLMFHHFPDELGVDDYLVRSTGFAYKESPIASFITSVTQSGFKRQGDGTYLKKSLPPLEFEYSKATIQDKVQDVDEESLENLPQGLDGAQYQWVDIDGEGLSGILTEQGDSWFFKRNVSALPVVGLDGQLQVVARFDPIERLATIPSFTNLAGGRQQLLDLAGDGQLDVVEFDSPTPGFYERTKDEAWHTFKPFVSLPNIPWQDPNLKFVDLTGDGHADIFITEEEAFTWYLSLAETGFASGEKVRQALDEEQGPKLVFADGTQSIYLADISGDGLSDLVRIRNSEVCYWPNLGYGRFGAKVTMDNSPHFDTPDHFDQRRIRLADIDGSGVTDIIYLKGDGVYIYLNESGNRWADAEKLKSFPKIDNLSSVIAVDLVGNGTACLVWSSPLPGANGKPLRYIDLMGGQKPHVLVKTVNNLGAETCVHYAPSTKFYLADKEGGKPWITRIPFPVHVVERVETFDRISRNRFVTQYAYHHGYFDGVEREFRGFGMVEQQDTEEYAALSQGQDFPAGDDVGPEISLVADELSQSQDFPVGDNIEESSHVPPVLTKTWFHTGAYLDRNHISNFFAGLLDANDIGEYYREPGLTDAQARGLLLEDTVLPDELTAEEEREACRALKGAMLRREVYALDGTDKEEHPYTVTEQNFTIKCLQARGDNRHAVFFTHPCEAINYHYERDPVDPRISHALTLEVDQYGNVRKEVAIGYGRRMGLSPLQGEDRDKQEQTLITYTENDVTNAIDLPVNHPEYDPDNYRTPLPYETKTYELTGFEPENNAERFSFDEWTRNDFAMPTSATEILYEKMADHNTQEKRLIEHIRILYRENDLSALLSPGELESLALPGEIYKLAFTPGLLDQVYQRPREEQPPGSPPPENLLPGQVTVLTEGGYVDLDNDDHWWIPSGRMFYSPNTGDSPSEESDYAQQHFFLPYRYLDPFGSITQVEYDQYQLLAVETKDALGNITTVKTKDDDQTIETRIDYRVLQPYWITGPNGNRSQVAFDALGMVVATAVMGKPGENKGDFINDDFKIDLSPTDIQNFVKEPRATAKGLLKNAGTRIIYDLDRYKCCGQPPFAATLAREIHARDPNGDQSPIQISFSYSDGFGREIQKKIQAEPGPGPQRDSQGRIILDANGQPQLTANDVNPRWVGSGWIIFNNKGKPVRRYEPFFTDTHGFEFDIRIGVSPVLFYDPVERVVATLRPNHTYEKVVFDPWRQISYDVNDTVAGGGEQTGDRGEQTGDPRTDPDIAGYVQAYFKDQADAWKTWYMQRQGGALGLQEQSAADKAAAHADTPTTACFDTLGRPFLTVAHNKVVCPDHDLDGTEDKFHTRVELDIEGNQRAVRDAVKEFRDEQGNIIADEHGRIVMRYDYDMLGNRIYQLSMEAGARWMLNDVAGQPIRAWDSRGHTFRTEYDPLRRPLAQYVHGTSEESDPRTLNPDHDILIDKIEYGEGQANPERLNLRTRIYRHFDSAGIATNARLDANGDPLEAYDFKGNLLYGTRRLVSDYKAIPDWPQHPQLEDETFEGSIRYDALNRPIQSIAPHSSLPQARRNVIQPVFNEANLLERVDVWLERPAEPDSLLDPDNEAPSPVGVANIDYDAKGQRQRIDYKNGASTFYEYDPETFRLVHLLTRRNPVDFPGDCPQQPPSGWPGCQVQNLHYTYDPAGNITHIRDEAQQTIFFSNKRVEPNAEYTYDALYRLIEATGREHLGLAGTPIPHSHNDADRIGLLSADAAGRFAPNDRYAMDRYIERYVYDAVGNFLEMQHHGSNLAQPGWRRTYEYNETSLIENGLSGTLLKTNNRLSRTTVGNDNQLTGQYSYDAHGNMTSMPHLPLMQWDYRDRLRATSQQVVNNGGTPEITYYVYDAAGQRVRKVTERYAPAGQTPTRKAERIYLGGFEIYREHNGLSAGSGQTVKLERETLHIMDDKQRIAMVETRTLDTVGNDPAPARLIRYQFGNHLGSASLELDEQAQIISYEEYTPYGSTSYQAVRSQTETPKRYRYTGMERDEETGLNYHGARYYAVWLGRWVSCDPAGLVDGVSVYVIARNNPIRFIDQNGSECRDIQGVTVCDDPIEAHKRFRAIEERERELQERIDLLVYGPEIRKEIQRNLKEMSERHDYMIQGTQGGILVRNVTESEAQEETARQEILRKMNERALTDFVLSGLLAGLGGGRGSNNPKVVGGVPGTYHWGARTLPTRTSAPDTSQPAAPTPKPAVTPASKPAAPAPKPASEPVAPAPTRPKIVEAGVDPKQSARAQGMARRTGHELKEFGPDAFANTEEVTLVAHGVVTDLSTGAILVRIRSSTGLAIDVTPSQLADLVVRYGWKGGTFRLCACRTGMPTRHGVFAKQFGSALSRHGAPSAVITPRNTVNLGSGLPQVRANIGEGGTGPLYSPGTGWDIYVE